MNIQQGIATLVDVITKEQRHPYYKRVNELRETYRRYVTGEGLDKELKIFARRESEALFKQRVEITQPIVRGVMKNILDVFRKVPRSRHSRVLGYTGENADAKKTELEGILSAFWGSQSLDDWFRTRYLELNATDPNAFVVVEWEPTDGTTRAQPYPFEVSSQEAIMFGYRNHRLEYLVSQNPMTIRDQGGEKKVHKYTIYLENDTAVLLPIDSTSFPTRPDGQFFGMTAPEEQGPMYVYINKVLYLLIVPDPHNLGRVPAFRAGYVRDMRTGGNTYVSPADSAIDLLRKTMKINSELDLAMALVAFPLTLRYAEPCDAIGCVDGYLEDESRCLSCQGTGLKRSTSVQEEITVKLPRNMEDLVDLEKLLVYKAPPVEVLRFQQEMVDKLSEKAKHAVFNSEVFSKNEVMHTATEKNIDLQNVYDTLFEFAGSIANSWKFAARVVGDVTGLGDGLVLSLAYAKDFKLKTLKELFEELKEAGESGAGPAVRQAIQNSIVSTVLIDDQTEYEKWATRERFNPFSGMSEEEIALALNSNYTPVRSKVLYLNLGSIFDSIENDTAAAGFYSMPYARQREIVGNQVEILMEEIASENTQPLNLPA